jgi:hypothetical protein
MAAVAFSGLHWYGGALRALLVRCWHVTTAELVPIEELAGRLFVLAREEHLGSDQWKWRRSHTCNGATEITESPSEARRRPVEVSADPTSCAGMLGGGVGVGTGGSVGYVVDNGSEDAGKPLLSAKLGCRPLTDGRGKGCWRAAAITRLMPGSHTSASQRLVLVSCPKYRHDSNGRVSGRSRYQPSIACEDSGATSRRLTNEHAGTGIREAQPACGRQQPI